MASDPVVMQRLAALEARMAAVEAGGGGGSQASSGAPGAAPSRLEPLTDHLLENSWADKAITKDPKQWKGPTMVGRTYSRAKPEWLEMQARNMEFKAMKGREEVPVRMNNKGKPWHESDTFEAKLCLAWALRNRAKVAAAPPPDEQQQSDDGPPF